MRLKLILLAFLLIIFTLLIADEKMNSTSLAKKGISETGNKSYKFTKKHFDETTTFDQFDMEQLKKKIFNNDNTRSSIDRDIIMHIKLTEELVNNYLIQNQNYIEWQYDIYNVSFAPVTVSFSDIEGAMLHCGLSLSWNTTGSWEHDYFAFDAAIAICEVYDYSGISAVFISIVNIINSLDGLNQYGQNLTNSIINRLNSYEAKIIDYNLIENINEKVKGKMDIVCNEITIEPTFMNNQVDIDLIMDCTATKRFWTPTFDVSNEECTIKSNIETTLHLWKVRRWTIPPISYYSVINLDPTYNTTQDRYIYEVDCSSCPYDFELYEAIKFFFNGGDFQYRPEFYIP